MQIYDKKGNEITVTNLSAAIRETREYMRMSHLKPEFRKLDQQRAAHWADLHYKLKKLQKSIKK